MAALRCVRRFLRQRSGEAGFTLVEELVTLTVSTVVAAAVMTVFTINTRETDSGIGNAMQQMSSSVVSETIGRDIRSGNRLLIPGETWETAGVYAAETTKTLLIHDDGGALRKGYRIGGVHLEETDAGGQWMRFRAGNADVRVDTASCFLLLQNRREAVVSIRTVYSGKQISYTAMNKQEMYRCRN